MNYWLISDTHFNHSKLQLNIWNGLMGIPAGDTLIHLGDICIGDDTDIHIAIAAYPFKKILVRGNHDKQSVNWYTEHGWDFVCDQIGLQFHGVDILLSHRPMPPDTWRWRYNIHGHTHGNMHRAEEYSAWYDAKNFHIDISPEIVGYAPIRLDTLMKKHKV